MNQSRPGDTLIEVLFAFAILATITGFAFTASLQSYKASVQAQNQTQAALIAQYHADGLKTYRDSMDWDGNPASFPSFLAGYTGGATNLPAMQSLIGTTDFCMKTQPGGVASAPLNWVVNTDMSDGPAGCNGPNGLNGLAPNLKGASVRIQLVDPLPAPPATPERITAVVTVTYDIPNANADGQVVNTIFLTKEQ